MPQVLYDKRSKIYKQAIPKSDFKCKKRPKTGKDKPCTTNQQRLA